MSILSNITSLFRRGNGTSATLSAYPDFASNEVERIRAGSRVLDDNGVASKAVDIVATACMGTEPVCKSGETVIETAATKLLTKPNPKDTGDKLIYRCVEDFYINEFGKAYFVLVGNVNYEPIELHKIDLEKIGERTNSFGDVVEIRITNDDYADTYYLDDSQNSHRYISTDKLKEIVVVEHPSGRGILNSVREELAILSKGLNRNGALIENGGRMSTLLGFKDGISDDEMRGRIQSIERVIRSKGYGGILGVNTGEGGVDVKEMGLTPRDMDFSQLYENCRREVYFRCGVPLPLVDNKAATDNNMAAAREMLIFNTVLPLCDLIYSILGDAIARREKKEYTCKTNQSIIPEVRSKLIREVKERKELGVETVNELRAQLGLDETTGGDEVLVEARLVPLDSLGESQQTGVMPKVTDDS